MATIICSNKAHTYGLYVHVLCQLPTTASNQIRLHMFESVYIQVYVRVNKIKFNLIDIIIILKT